MSGVAINIKYDDAVASDAIRQLLTNIEHADTDELLEEIGGYVDSSTAQRFQDSVAPDGKSWKESQRVIDEGGKTLVDSTRLRDSFSPEVDNDELNYGSNAIYAAIQHFGGETGRGKKTVIDARPIVGLNSFDLDNIGDISDKWAEGLLK